MNEDILPTTPIDLIDGDVEYLQHFLTKEEADRLFHHLLAETPWRQDKIRMFGKWVNIPRLQAWYGDSEAHYTYSGLTLSPLPFTESLLQLKEKIEQYQLSNDESRNHFNATLLNLYRDGNDGMGWHSDNEKELGVNPVIASISLGSTRRFQFKHRQDSTLKHDIDLTHGSLLIMKGATQQHWLHGIPKQRKVTEPRINLTFRQIFPN